MNRRRIAEHMAAELEASRLAVTLAPALRGSGKVRVVESVNPSWYRRLCAVYARYRDRWQKPKTYIKRQHTLAALRRIADGDATGAYATRLVPLMQRVADDLRAEALSYRRTR